MAPSWHSSTLHNGVHAFLGGEGTTIVLLSGWPETAEAYSEMFPLLSESYHVIAIDLPGLGDSEPSAAGYDTATISRLVEEAVRPVAGRAYHLVGHDVGSWAAYAWAAQFPQRLLSLSVLDGAPPGLTAPGQFPLAAEANVKLWQFSFNTLPELPETLTEGRERELFDWLIRHKAQHPERIPEVSRQRYVDCYSRPGAMTRGFAYYRATPESASQNVAFSKHKLPMPVLALGGAIGMGDALRKAMEPLANRVEGGVIEDCGHYVMEEQPEEVASRLLAFFRKEETSPR